VVGEEDCRKAPGTSFGAHWNVRALAVSVAGDKTIYAGCLGGSVWQLTGILFNDGFESTDACLWSSATGGGC
jgi:hypothetical protein